MSCNCGRCGRDNGYRKHTGACITKEEIPRVGSRKFLKKPDDHNQPAYGRALPREKSRPRMGMGLHEIPILPCPFRLVLHTVALAGASAKPAGQGTGTSRHPWPPLPVSVATGQAPPRVCPRCSRGTCEVPLCRVRADFSRQLCNICIFGGINSSSCSTAWLTHHRNELAFESRVGS
jgi:hypothetical protein